MKKNKGYSMADDVEEILFSEKQIIKISKRLGKQISKDYAGKDLLLVCILKGSVIAMADIMRNITIPCEIDFMVASCYGSGTEPQGDILIKKDLSCSIEGRDVLLIEDIIDTGITLSKLVPMLAERRPASIKTCTFLDKPERRRVDFVSDYVGEAIPNKFIIGYGLDYDEKYRNLPYIGVIKESAIKK